jgi:hypothetical protein
MTYTSAVAWVAGMNAYQDPGYDPPGYLGHDTWQLPTAPHTDTSPSCTAKGPGPYHESFGFGCKENALGFLYYEALGLEAPNTAIPIPPNTVGPFSNLQPNLYWSGSKGGNKNSLACTIANFSFGSGAQGGGCGGDFADVLPMIPAKIFATSATSGMGLQVNKSGTLVYDPETIVTWLADANLAANWLPETEKGEFDTMGLPLCKTAPDTKPCVALDGSMNYESAKAFVKAMNHYEDPITPIVGYLGLTDWQLPPVSANCKTYGCGGDPNPMGNLYYYQLDYDGQPGFPAGTPVVPVPDIAVGPFNHLQPFPYWECLADTIQDACEIGDQFPYTPAKNSEWGFSFGTGFLGTERFTADHYVTAYYVGCDPDMSWCQSITFAPITATEDAKSKLALSATASSGLAVSFTSTTPKVCTVSGKTASLLIPGTCTIEASQAGNDSFESALPVQRTFTVDRAKEKINFPLIPTQKQGADVHLRATVSSGLKVAYDADSSRVIMLAIPLSRLAGPGATSQKSGNRAFATSLHIRLGMMFMPPHS